ncbi:MAG TPA: ABC transporter substrate-binding protein [Stellaceae bacterium]|nr:ABC transporter substrate-binding protein [Stellaceae bacterium]
MYHRRNILLGSMAAALAVSWRSASAADTVKLGAVIPTTGPLAEAGRYALQGATLAVDEANRAGGVSGRPVELVIEDDQSTNPGTVLAFNKLISDPEITAILGPTRSTQIGAIAPDILKAGKPVMIGGTDPRLTQAGNPWLFRCRPNDIYTARVIAAFGLETLGKRKWAIVHSTDAFGTSASQLLIDALAKQGVTPVLRQGQPNNSLDFTPVALAVRQSGADIVSSFITFETDLAVFARQLRQLGVNLPWIGSPSITTTTALKLAGAALYGTFGVADFHRDANPEAREFAQAYQAKYGTAPDFFGAWPYDATRILTLALSQGGGGEPQQIRDALLSLRGYRGVEGTYGFDRNGDGLHSYNIVKNVDGTVVLDRHIEFDD